MTDSSVRQLRELFEEVLEQPADRREAHVRHLCAFDPVLEGELLRLVRKDAALGDADSDTGAASGLASRALNILADFSPEGQEFGPFRIEARIGQGGMGAVYRVRRTDGQVQQEAALKLLRPESLNPSLLSRFSNERKVLASMVHPGICRFLDVGNLPGQRPYVLMELIDGLPLLDYCDRQALGLSARLRLFVKVLDAVGYAHGKLVVHRDLKSSNVLVTADGQPKLLDFGIAKSLEADESETTQTVDRFLTPKSAAPEQVLGESVGVGCDLYALGQLLYELLCGLPPFDFSDGNAARLQRLILEQPPPPMAQRCLEAPAEVAQTRGLESLRQLSRGLSGDLEIIVSKCLRKRPDERYGSVGLLQEDLSRVLDNRPILARPNQRWYRARKFLSRHRLPVALVAALSLTLVVASALTMFQAAALNEQRTRAILERDKAQHAVSLLKEAFVAADPAQVSGADVTARQILASARDSTDKLYDSQPALYASVTAVIAEVELELSLNDSAAELARRALEAGRRAGISDEEMRRLWLLNGRALLDSPDRELALEAINRVAAMDQENQPDLLVLQGRYQMFQRQHEQAIELLQQAVAALADRSPEDGLAVSARWQLSHAQSLAGRHRDSIKTLDETLAWMAPVLGEAHPRLTLTRLWRIDSLRRAGLPHQGELEQATVEQLIRDHYGNDSAMAGRAHATFGMLQLGMQRYEAAIDHYRRALEAWERTLGIDHPNLLRVWANLTQAIYLLGENDSQAGPLFRQALADASARYGEDSAVSLNIRGYYARHLAREGQAIDALALLLDPVARGTTTKIDLVFWRRANEEVYQTAGCGMDGADTVLEAHCAQVEAILGQVNHSLGDMP